MSKLLCLILLSLVSYKSFSQRNIAITIDDVPNVRLYQADGYSSVLLKKLDSLHLPVAIFINEGNLKQTTDTLRNSDLLKTWLLKDFITPGNHGYQHKNYGEVGFVAFEEDILKGEELTRKMLKGSGKTLRYFRFPFNSLGKDSVEHERMDKYLEQKKYVSVPFTAESEDWLYTQLYEKALSEGDKNAARLVGEQYVQQTLKVVAYFDSLSLTIYKRSVNQIYLCHDNRLNSDYLPDIIEKLKQKNYQFVSLKAAINDPVYKSKDFYNGNAGFSWMYRWMQYPAERRAAMRAEPANPEIQKAFEEMNKKK